jgi:protein-L-isoaspartate(D-aspartate) O-methyltransferase
VSGDATSRRQQLVGLLSKQGVIPAGPIEAAFRAVPRHLFVPGAPLDEVYSDQAIPTKWIDGSPVSSSSQPAIMAAMLAQLDLRPGQSVLEIGAATGYNAALLAQIVGPGGRVLTIDIDEDLVAGAREHLAAAAVENVEVVCADGAEGWPERAPYDRIIVTVGAADIASAWREQLRPGGRLVLPLSLRSGQLSIAFENIDGVLHSRSLVPCGFLMLRGSLAGPPSAVSVGEVPGLSLAAPDPQAVSATAVARLLDSPAAVQPTGFVLNERDCDATPWWLTFHEPSAVQWWQTAEGARQRPLPALRVFPQGQRAGVAIVTSEAVVLVATGAPKSAVGDDMLHPASEAVAHCYGPQGEIEQRLRNLLRTWHAAGRPGLDDLSVRAYPAGKALECAAGEVAIARPHSRLVVGWRN